MISLAWGWEGAEEAALRGDAVVIVDVLRFSTAVCAACESGVLVKPTGWPAGMGEEERKGSLSPVEMQGFNSGDRVTLASPNGSQCVRRASGAPQVLIGSLMNAQSVAAIVDSWNMPVTVVACGERPGERLRLCEEDFLGAGAILSHVGQSLTSEATKCRAHFLESRARLSDILHTCESGQELIGRGKAEDVSFAARLDSAQVVPILREGWLQAR
jgi:2-phosphosulfolactate phosphatase